MYILFWLTVIIVNLDIIWPVFENIHEIAICKHIRLLLLIIYKVDL